MEGLCVITPTVHGDARGYFMETYQPYINHISNINQSPCR
nr:dTDP-4-dehydrorhamnose 3,5-epimerase family protein [Megasphaera sp. UBA4233]